MRIAVDAMGGDKAPGEIVRGAVAALKQGEVELLLVGIPEKIEKELAPFGNTVKGRIEIVPATDVIGMNESPARALRQKKEASVLLAARLVKEGRAQAFVSAGNTGATMGAALFQLGRIKGIKRPAIASPLPTTRGMSLLIDAGANADASPLYLSQFAQMGAIYLEDVWGIANPKVGLLNIASEPKKGNELSRKAYTILEKLPLNFHGNVEGREIAAGAVDVVVCDGFVGNIVLKLIEGLAQAFTVRLKGELKMGLRNRLGASLALPAFRRFRRSLDYQEYGGAPLLGVKGICIICHGSSNARAIENAIGAAAGAIKGNIVAKIAENIREIGGE
ncbi:MAG: phosphate acyltransferase PlsX [Firmicutes bacterium]|nr:phosphate acyltransferase PlsX [Bacillota bacterium]